MKKILAMTAAVGFLFTALATAAPVKDTNYYSTQKPRAEHTAAYPATDITINNSTADIIYATVPGTPIYDILYPNSNDHIYNDTYYGMTRVILKDPYQYSFFDSYVCRYAIVSVYGYPGSYNVYVNSNYCY